MLEAIKENWFPLLILALQLWLVATCLLGSLLLKSSRRRIDLLLPSEHDSSISNHIGAPHDEETRKTWSPSSWRRQEREANDGSQDGQS